MRRHGGERGARADGEPVARGAADAAQLGDGAQTDERLGLELAPLHVRKEVGPAGDQHGLRPRVGEEPHGLADRARRQIAERRQAQHQ